MKVLHLNGYFLLPDSFKGTEADAIELLAKYHRRKMKKNKVVVKKEMYGKVIKGKEPDDPWKEFLMAIANGRRLYAVIFCGEVDRRTAKGKSP